jgi:hypothetical protein
VITPRRWFFATQFRTEQRGPVTFGLRGPADSAWLNGKAVEPGECFSVEAVPGLNTLVLRVRSVNWPEGVALESGGVVFLAE